MDFFQSHRLLALILISNAVGFIIYWGIGVYFLYRYYYSKKHLTEQWKCQPDKMPSFKLIARDFLQGSFILLILSTASGFFIHYIVLNDLSKIYYNFSQHHLGMTLFWGVVYILSLDLMLYWAHRFFHLQTLFRKIHYLHHRTGAPISFTAFSMHPLEALTYHSITFLPFLIIPVHYVIAIIVLIYTNFVSLFDHSGIKLKPWVFGQSPTLFHDDHHQYFHVNYGQNFWFWDKIFDSWRIKDNEYGSTAFETVKDCKRL